MAASTLQHYWDLASFDPAVRINAAQSLVRSLAEFQKDHEATIQNGTHKTATTEDELDTLCAPDVSYALRRLLRGLPSSRQGARQGFSLALTEVKITIYIFIFIYNFLCSKFLTTFFLYVYTYMYINNSFLPLPMLLMSVSFLIFYLNIPNGRVVCLLTKPEICYLVVFLE